MTNSDLNRALAAFNAGRLDEARQVLTRLLQASAQNLDALYLLAVTEQTRQNHQASLSLYDRLLTLRPQHDGAHYNKALLLSQLERHEEALQHHNQAVRLAPRNVWAYINRGNSLAKLKKYTAAIADYDQALALQPASPDALINKGNALCEQRRHQEALACHEAALQLQPQHVAGWIGRCQALAGLERHEEAIASASHAIQLHPQHPEAWLRRSVSHLALELAQDALSDAEQAITIHPRYADAWASRGDALLDLNRHAEALDSYDKAIELQPQLIHAHMKKAVALEDVQHDDLAKSCYETALALDPEHVELHWNLSQLLLRQQNYHQGWAEYEYRWRSQVRGSAPLDTTRPVWNGAPSGGRLLLWGEQGIGDQILHASMLHDVMMIPRHKMVALDKRLLPLFTRSMPGIEFLDRSTVTDALDFSEQLPLGSLGRLFRQDRSSFANAQHPYLTADTSRSTDLRQKIVSQGKLVCGISWFSRRQLIGKHKSIALADLLSGLSPQSLHFVNLQYGDTAQERAELLARDNIAVQSLDEIDNFHDIDGLSALIQACDIVITTSNTTAHLAGALGKETLLLLPIGHGRLWYWVDQAGHSLWYPSIRTFPQQVPGKWDQPLRAIKDYLEQKQWN